MNEMPISININYVGTDLAWSCVAVLRLCEVNAAQERFIKQTFLINEAGLHKYVIIKGKGAVFIKYNWINLCYAKKDTNKDLFVKC